MFAEILRFKYTVNRKKNDTGRRRLSSSNRAAIFVSTSFEERHNKPQFGYKLSQSTENNKVLLFFSGKETIQTFKRFQLSRYAVVCEVINF